jgi:hypothetical protein
MLILASAVMPNVWGEVLILLTNMGRCKNQLISMIFVIDFKEKNRNDPTFFNFGSLPGIYTVLLDQHNGLKPSS